MNALPLRVAYMVTSYQPAEELWPLVSALKRGDPESAVLIYQDSSRGPFNAGLFAELPDVHVLSSVEPIVWGDITQETSRWLGFRWILKNLDVDWVMVLSGQDYPLAPFSQFHERLVSAGADAVICGERIDLTADPEQLHEWTRRYLFHYRRLPLTGVEYRLPERWRRPLTHARRLFYGAFNRAQPWLFIYALPVSIRQATRIGWRAKHSPFSDKFPCWHHEPWYALSKTALQHVVDYLDRNPGFIHHYAATIVPVESATGTIIFNDPELTVDNSALHEIRWSNPLSGRPDEFGIEDLEFLRSSGAMFARKFPSNSGALFDELDKDIS